MLGFTKSETRILFFLVISFLIGCGVWAYRRWMEPLPVVEVETSSPPESATVKEVQSFHQSESDTLTKVILNTASGIELERLPGVGPVMAKRILEYRDKQGPFQSIEELIHIKGIGQKTIKKIEPYLLVNSVQERLR